MRAERCLGERERDGEREREREMERERERLKWSTCREKRVREAQT